MPVACCKMVSIYIVHFVGDSKKKRNNKISLTFIVIIYVSIHLVHFVGDNKKKRNNKISLTFIVIKLFSNLLCINLLRYWDYIEEDIGRRYERDWDSLDANHEDSVKS